MLSPINPDNPFQADWRETLNRTDAFLSPDSAPPMMFGERDSCATIYGMSLDIANLSGFSVKQLTGENRRQELSRWRQLGYYVGTKVLGKSTTQVGRVLNRDHSSVCDGRKKFAWLCETHTEWLDRYEKIARGLQ